MQKSPLLCNDSVTKTPMALMLAQGGHLRLCRTSPVPVSFGTRALEMFSFVPKLYFLDGIKHGIMRETYSSFSYTEGYASSPAE